MFARSTRPPAQQLSVYGASAVCPVCSMQFSSRTRLQAHITESRVRGSRLINCGCVIRAGLVEPAESVSLAKAVLSDREARREARKRGMTQPRSVVHAKRLRIGGSLALAASSAHAERQKRDPESIPANALDWLDIKPAKRLRAKTSVDQMVADGSATL